MANISVLLGASVSGGTTASGVTTGGTVTGGIPVTVAAANLTATGFTATLPAKVGADVPLTITTTGGSVTYLHAFTSLNGITVSPNAVVQGGKVDIDITGAGFLSSAYTFSNTGSAGTPTTTGQGDATSHVFLVKGVYNATGYAGATQGPHVDGTVKATPQVAECTDVFVISDGELICTLDTAQSVAFTATGTTGNGWAISGSAVPYGAYTLALVDKSDASALASTTNHTAVSAGSTFTVGQF